MKKLKHLIYSIRMAWMIFRNPQIAQFNAFEMTKQLMDTVTKCQKHNRPMSFVCYVNIPDGEKLDLFQVWVGVGSDNPIKRNTKLAEEIEFLKQQMSRA